MSTKGGNNENLVGREISLLWSQGKRNDLIRRTEGSGSRFTKKKQKGEEGTISQAGDLTFSNSEIKPFFDYYCCENKAGYSRKSKIKGGIKVVNWCILDIIDSKQKEPVFVEMWNQCKRDAVLSSRIPLLIFRRDNMQICIAFDRTEYNKLGDYFGFNNSIKNLIISKGYFEQDIIIMKFNDWKEWVGEGLETFINIHLRSISNEKEHQTKTGKG